MGFWTLLLIAYILLSISLYFLFPKMSVPAWKGLVPGLNMVEWAKVVGRKPAHAAWLLFPIVNIFIFAGLAIDTIRSFGHLGFWQSVLSVLFAPFYFLFLAFQAGTKYEGPAWAREMEYRHQIEEAHKAGNTKQLNKLLANNPYKKSATREWAEAIIFAVFAATFIRMFLIEAMLPLLHNRIPQLGMESYLRKPSLKYKRLPAFESIDRNDPVVFNYPEGDSVYVFPHRTWSIYDYRRGSLPPTDNQEISNGKAKLVARPTDKMDHYIKRCVALPGDSLQIINRQLYINGKPAQNPKYIQFIHHLKSPGRPINDSQFSKWGVSKEDVLKRDAASNSMLVILNETQVEKIRQMDQSISAAPCNRYFVTVPVNYDPTGFVTAGIDNANISQAFGPNSYLMYLTDKEAEAIQKDTAITVNPFILEAGRLFPHDPENHPDWTVDNYGPVFVPKRGTTVKLNSVSMPFYRRVIAVYEKNKLEEKDGKYYINGKQADSYTFTQDYFWMMGDNRHNSEDARVWGFVPENHIVGKPLFIWFSTREGSFTNGINWNRIFRSVSHLGGF
jgi:signal peptidase I